MIYSASAIRAQERFGDPMFFLKKQAIWAALGSAGHGVGRCLDLKTISAA